MKRIEHVKLIEYGCLPVAVTEKWAASATDDMLVIGVNNSDTKGLIMKQLIGSIGGFSEMVAAVMEGLECPRVLIFLPDVMSGEDQQIYRQHFAGLAEICIGKIDVRSYADKAVIHHPETIIRLAELLQQKGGPAKRWVFCEGQSLRLDVAANYQTIIEAFELTDIVGLMDGGVSGKYVPKDQFSQPMGTWGSGELIPLRASDCLVYKAREAAEALYRNSCGKCTFCREGSYQLKMIFRDVVRGKCEKNDYQQVSELAEVMPEQSLCSFGQCGMNLFQYLVAEEELLSAHIEKRECGQGVCFQEGMRYAIRGDLCRSCGQCTLVCPKNCIDRKEGFVSMINEFICDNCGLCAAACEQQAITKVPDEVSVGPCKWTVAGRYLKATGKELRG